MSRSPFIAVVLSLSAFGRPLLGQCPNGTPPPCTAARPTAATPAPAPNSVAVLYFEARDTTDGFLAEGLSEEIATSLGHVTRLAVKIPSAVRRVQRANEGNVRAIGRALGVRWLVDGTVRRNGSQVRVSVRLVDAERETAAWSSAFTPATTDLLTIQQNIAREVATGIVGTLTPVERATVTSLPTANAEAYEHYLKGNVYLGRRGQWLERAVEEYQLAVKLDPSFDAARAGIALALASAIDYGNQVMAGAPGRTRPAVLALADSVIQRNPSIAMAWIARGVALAGSGRVTPARESLERAIAIDPNNVEAHFRLGQTFARAGAHTAARSSLQRALALDPARPVTYQLLGVVAYFERRNTDAIRLLDSALVLDPQYSLAMSWQAIVLYFVGDTGRARVMANARSRLASSLSNEAQRALAAAKSFPDTIRSITMYGHRRAQAHALVGPMEEALTILGQPVFPECRSVIRDPVFDPVRRDPRFQAHEAACLALKEPTGPPG